MTILYLHGFGSGPDSSKGLAFERHFRALGETIHRLNLRVPSFEHMRLGAMVELAQSEIRAHKPVILIGSSLGGLTASRAQEKEPGVKAMVLLAPAFRFAERWGAKLGDQKIAEWRSTGWLSVTDYANKVESRVDSGFLDEAVELDSQGGGWPVPQVPTLVIHGKNDDVVDIGLSREWAKQHSNVELVEVDDGHWLMNDLPFTLKKSTEFLAPFLSSATKPLTA